MGFSHPSVLGRRPPQLAIFSGALDRAVRPECLVLLLFFSLARCLYPSNLRAHPQTTCDCPMRTQAITRMRLATSNLEAQSNSHMVFVKQCVTDASRPPNRPARARRRHRAYRHSAFFSWSSRIGREFLRRYKTYPHQTGA